MFLKTNMIKYIYDKISIIGYIVIIIALLRLPLALAAGPPPGVDQTAWCEQNADECSEWCAENSEEDICQEPDCD